MYNYFQDVIYVDTNSTCARVRDSKIYEFAQNKNTNSIEKLEDSAKGIFLSAFTKNPG